MLECKHCGRWSEMDELVTVVKANNLMAYCPACEAWIKNLPQHPGRPPMLYFGKHSGKLIVEVAEEDPQYLTWMTNQPWCKAKLKAQIETVLRG